MLRHSEKYETETNGNIDYWKNNIYTE